MVSDPYPSSFTGIEICQRLGRYRWVVERTFAWLNRYRRLTIRYERRADIHQASLGPWLRVDLFQSPVPPEGL